MVGSTSDQNVNESSGAFGVTYVGIVSTKSAENASKTSKTLIVFF